MMLFAPPKLPITAYGDAKTNFAFHLSPSSFALLVRLGAPDSKVFRTEEFQADSKATPCSGVLLVVDPSSNEAGLNWLSY